MNFIKLIVILSFLFLANLNGEETQKENTPKEVYTYVNIDANVNDTTILLDGKEIGKTPIASYKVQANKPLQLTAIADKNYYEKDIVKTVTLRENTQKDVDFKFTKAKAKLFFIGEKAQLFINNKFIKELHEENRVITVDADKNVEIYLEDNYRSRMLFKDIKANQLLEIPYKLILIPKDLRLFTTTVDNLMWEDTKHAAEVKVDWITAKEYCEDLDIAGITDWEMPTIEELKSLEEKYKDKIYYGHGKTFYWSNKTSESKDKIWSYAEVVDFEKGKIKRPIKDIPNGYIRCVRKIGDVTAITVSDPNNEEEEKPNLGYDPELTKDLQQYMLK